MRIHRFTTAVAFAVLVTAPLSAQPAPVGTPCTAPAGTFGLTGIPVSNSLCSTAMTSKMWLNVTPRYTSPGFSSNGLGTWYALPGNSTGGPTNAGFGTWNVDWASNTASRNDVFRVSWDLDPGLGVSFFSFVVPSNNWDSSNYGYLPSGWFDNTVAGTYTVKMDRYDLNDATFSNSLDELSGNVVVGNPTVTPEPATLGLLATGMLGIGFVTRRRKRSTTLA